eukprot:CAMPEP_0198293448 /NCGR_PEP_ID=MMETSP1449-20131203/17327_1 /TAXON_ID=420275 /ORGANISM="Attheya septentrionalis, Strain CCMP2084" /LENGTH=282 /DNA_ID=CAMNT_0043993037 /DNA_START=123 /DNA_END=968 /DNA_ORIENTATION=-
MESLSEQQRVQVVEMAQSGLEMVLHLMLYQSGLYPKSGYMKTKYGGAHCWVHRMPDVVSYIGETLQTAVPALLSSSQNTTTTNHPTTLSLIFLDVPSDKGGDEPILSFPPNNGRTNNDDDIAVPQEEYAFQLSSMLTDHSEPSGSNTNNTPKTKEEVDQMLLQLEKKMRDLMIRILGLSIPPKRMWSPRAYFKITLTLSSPNDATTNATINNDAGLESLDQSLQDGTWLPSEPPPPPIQVDNESQSIEEQPRKMVRPLTSMRVPSCGFRVQLLSFVPPRENN